MRVNRVSVVVGLVGFNMVFGDNVCPETCLTLGCEDEVEMPVNGVPLRKCEWSVSRILEERLCPASVV